MLACARVSPQWELGALRVLMKPHDWTRGAIEHQPKRQPWPAGAREAVEAARADVARALGFEPPVHFPDEGEYWVVAEVEQRQIEAARALAVVWSRRVAGVWFTIDRLYVRDGKFYRRERGYKFNLVEATNVHLAREVRGRLRGVL